MASFLRQLHSVKEKQVIDMGASPQVFDRTEVDRSITLLNERVDKIINGKLCQINKKIYGHEINAIRTIKLPKDNHCLVHGDLYSRHLLFNNGKLTGIIDWGDVGINNPSVDLSVIWSFYPSHCHETFLKLYGEVDPATWQYARFLGLYSALTTLLYSHDINDLHLTKESIQSIRRINQNLLER